ncbi:MAG: hypothetical protein HGB12_10180 [Bacteroidetes bacterium]|nr:hypothetical protein [Bacteroidota bacterium]
MASNTFKEKEKVAELPPEEPEFTEVKEQKKKKKKKENPLLKGLRSVMDGTILTRNLLVRRLPFLLYIVFIAILYIGNSFYVEKRIIEIEKIKKELKELRSENISIKSKLMNCSRQSEIIKRITSSGIKESLCPPNKIFVQKDTTIKN